MVILSRDSRARGWLMVELLAAMALLTAAVLPLAYSVASEKRLARAQYHRAIAMQIVDGEFEMLAGGGWRGFAAGTNVYQPTGWALTNLPAGRYVLTVAEQSLRLEWQPEGKPAASRIVREGKKR